MASSSTPTTSLQGTTNVHPATPATQIQIQAQTPTPTPTLIKPSPSPAIIAFISGPLEPGDAYFATHYIPLLQRAIAQRHYFILGASRGVDTMARHFLLANGVPARCISVFLSTQEGAPARRSKFGLGSFQKAGGRVVVAGKNHTAHDEAMTRASHYDILRYNTEAECRVLYGSSYRKRVSGTELNELRRKTGIGLQLPAPPQPPH